MGGLLTRSRMQTGCQEYTQALELRRAWIADTFPDRIAVVTDGLREVVDARAQLVKDSQALWEEYYQDWFDRTATRLPTGDLCSALSRNLEILQKFSDVGQKQYALVSELKVSVRVHLSQVTPQMLLFSPS